MDVTLLRVDMGDAPHISVHTDDVEALKTARVVADITDDVPDEEVLAAANAEIDTISLGMVPGLYEKCSLCHLFVEPNDSQGMGIAPYVHLSRGDEADERIEAWHDATPSGMVATLATWQVFGPSAMRERFVILNPYGPNPLER